MKVTILGCGPASGVPSIGNEWGKCDPKNPRNRRTRVSVLVEEGDQSILIDTSPDMRQQLLDCNLRNLTAVLFTHAHADHCHGIDDLRAVNWLMKKPVDVYANPVTLKELESRFEYVFRGTAGVSFYKPTVTPHAIEKPFKLGGVHVTPFAQDHITMSSLGLRLNDFAYSTDVKNLDDAAFEALKGVKVWVVDCVQEEPHPTHSHLAQTLEWIARVKPERAYLTHMSKSLDYNALAAKCPKGVAPAYDGMVIEC